MQTRLSASAIGVPAQALTQYYVKYTDSCGCTLSLRIIILFALVWLYSRPAPVPDPATSCVAPAPPLPRGRGSRDFVAASRLRPGALLCSYFNPLPALPYPGIVVGAVHGRRGTRAAARGAPGAAW